MIYLRSFGACTGELADEELARKLQAEEDARASRRSDRASRLAAAAARSRRSTRSAAPLRDASSEVSFTWLCLSRHLRTHPLRGTGVWFGFSMMPAARYCIAKRLHLRLYFSHGTGVLQVHAIDHNGTHTVKCAKRSWQFSSLHLWRLQDDSDSDRPRRRTTRHAAKEAPVDPYRRTRGARAGPSLQLLLYAAKPSL